MPAAMHFGRLTCSATAAGAGRELRVIRQSSTSERSQWPNQSSMPRAVRRSRMRPA
jgi:hypothetical protein